MDSFVEKQGFYDYINHLITGVTMIIGFTAAMSKSGKQFLGYLFSPIVYFKFYRTTNTFLVNALFFSVLLLTSFIIGILIQVTYSILYERNDSVCHAFSHPSMPIQRTAKVASSNLYRCLHLIRRFLFKVNKLNMISHIFDENGPVDNQYKREKYKKYAETLIRDKHIGGIDWENKYTTEFAHYFYAYCVYYIQVRNHNHKVEKLRDIAGLASSLTLVFTFLCCFTAVLWLFTNYEQDNRWRIICFIAFFFISILFDYHAERASKNQIKMVLALYEAEKEQEQGAGI